MPGAPPFETVGELGHALAGTTSLVGAESLADSARLLEETARAGQEALRQMERHAARARALAGVCRDGAVQMRQMLALELDKRTGRGAGDLRAPGASAPRAGRRARVGVRGQRAVSQAAADTAAATLADGPPGPDEVSELPDTFEFAERRRR